MVCYVTLGSEMKCVGKCEVKISTLKLPEDYIPVACRLISYFLERDFIVLQLADAPGSSALVDFYEDPVYPEVQQYIHTWWMTALVSD